VKDLLAFNVLGLSGTVKEPHPHAPSHTLLLQPSHYPTPYTLHPTPYTLHPHAPSAAEPPPYTLHPTLYTHTLLLQPSHYPTPCTLHPTLHTLRATKT